MAGRRLMPSVLTRIIHRLLSWIARRFSARPTNEVAPECQSTAVAQTPLSSASAPVATETHSNIELAGTQSLGAIQLDSRHKPVTVASVAVESTALVKDEQSGSYLVIETPSHLGLVSPNSTSIAEEVQLLGQQIVAEISLDAPAHLAPYTETPPPEAARSDPPITPVEGYGLPAESLESPAREQGSAALYATSDQGDLEDTPTSDEPEDSLLPFVTRPATTPAATDSRVGDSTVGESAKGNGSQDIGADLRISATTMDVSEPRQLPAYRPRLRTRPRTTTTRSKSMPRKNRGTGGLDADLILTFQPGGWGIAASILLRRPEGMPEQVAIRVGSETISLVAIDDEFFEPLPLSNISAALQDGIVVKTADAVDRRWIRTPRTLHVFSERPGIPGFVSVPRAVIGQENVILCINGISASALDLCKGTGANDLVEVTGPGVADGWRCFRGYRPKRQAKLECTEEILLALNPLPHAVIELAGGISVSRSVWISDRPPTIRIVGIDAAQGEVTIDGQPATIDDGVWTTRGWDRCGQHTVHYAGLSRSYEIVETAETWPTWHAHSRDQFYACGATVSGRPDVGALVLLSPSGCWLLGAEPGQVSWATPSAYGSAIASPAFRPVWAIFPRHAGTRCPPRLFTKGASPRKPTFNSTPAAQRQWCQLLLDARAHLDNSQDDALWQLYRQAARMQKRGGHR
ncbi:hypothetical protein AWB69_00748 [Caballeronia udeis]|uniref:Uncharacterized protein n=1 Tax=Caballeronia udeis TaxID=1232866 RepID=A0A158F8F9_9BURK|nr:hypothetical protein AWB69_00748 [Caballeronia udeis]